MMSKSIGIIGMGYVGQAFASFISQNYSIITYDIKDNAKYPSKEIASCALTVVCVPTPIGDMSAVECAVELIESPLIMIKSTVAPGTTDRLKQKTGKRIVFSPEYIGESTYHNPVYKTMNDSNFHIVGGDSKDVKDVFGILEVVAGPYCVYYGCSALEAEIIKYMVNSFLASKVTFVNEFYEIAKAFGADWHRVREGWLLDERIGRAFSSVFSESRGFGGKCLPKDTATLIAECERVGYSPDLLKSVIACNNKFKESVTKKNE